MLNSFWLSFGGLPSLVLYVCGFFSQLDYSRTHKYEHITMSQMQSDFDDANFAKWLFIPLNGIYSISIAINQAGSHSTWFAWSFRYLNGAIERLIEKFIRFRDWRRIQNILTYLRKLTSLTFVVLCVFHGVIFSLLSNKRLSFGLENHLHRKSM